MTTSSIKQGRKNWMGWIAFVMLFLFAGCGGSDDGPEVQPRLEISPTALTVTGIGEFQVKSDGDWEITSSKDWCAISPHIGSGDAKVTVTITEDNLGSDQNAVVTVKRGGLLATVTVTPGSLNGIPSVPELLNPVAGTTGISVFPDFKWSISSDPDYDPVTYTVSFSTDGISWGKESKNLTKCEYSMPDAPLAISTKYWWRVKAKDGKGGESVSVVGTFTTGSVAGYSHGEKWKPFSHTKGNRGARLVFIGDGFVAADHEKGGAFEIAVRKGMDGLFSFEPFKTYKDYFDVHAIAFYSEERGITVETEVNRTKKTFFDVRFVENPSMAIGADHNGDVKVFDEVKRALNLTDGDLQETVIILIANEDRYGGACYMNTKKQTIAICAYSSQLLDPSGMLLGNYVNIIAHETGGHGIGLLAEEYTLAGQEETNITTSSTEVTSFKEYVAVGGYANVDLEGDLGRVKWKEFIGLPGYEAVGAYEGGQNYGKGVWRAEERTCMDNNSLYYSAPARMAIVNRIMQMSKDTPLTLEQFVENDKVKILPPSSEQ